MMEQWWSLYHWDWTNDITQMLLLLLSLPQTSPFLLSLLLLLLHINDYQPACLLPERCNAGQITLCTLYGSLYWYVGVIARMTGRQLNVDSNHNDARKCLFSGSNRKRYNDGLAGSIRRCRRPQNNDPQWISYHITVSSQMSVLERDTYEPLSATWQCQR